MNWLLNFDKFKIKQKNCQKSFNTLTGWLNFAQRVTLLLTAFIYGGGHIAPVFSTNLSLFLPFS